MSISAGRRATPGGDGAGRCGQTPCRKGSPGRQRGSPFRAGSSHGSGCECVPGPKAIRAGCVRELDTGPSEHQGLLSGIEAEAHYVPELFLKLKVLGELESRTRWGWSLWADQSRCTLDLLRPVSLAHGAHAPGPAVRSPCARPTQGPPYSLGWEPRLTSPSRGVSEPLQALGRRSLSNDQWPKDSLTAALRSLGGKVPEPSPR